MARLHASQLDPTGSYLITGSLDVYGQSTFYQTEAGQSALIVSGAMEIVRAQLQSEIYSASLSVQNLGIFGDRADNREVDLGGFF